MKYYLYRLKYNRNYKIVFILLFIFMTYDAVLLHTQMPTFDPNMGTFLAGAGMGHYMEKLILWLLPAYLILVAASWFLTDEKNRYSTILMTRFEKKKYLQNYLLHVFISVFLLFFLNFVLNYIVVHIVNYGGTYNAYIGSEDFAKEMMRLSTDLRIQIQNPIICNFIYMITTATLFGIFAVFMSCLSLYFNKIAYVFLLSFAIWLIFCIGGYSILLACQPFNEYPLIFQAKLYGITVLGLLSVSVMLYVYRMKKDEM